MDIVNIYKKDWVVFLFDFEENVCVYELPACEEITC